MVAHLLCRSSARIVGGVGWRSLRIICAHRGACPERRRSARPERRRRACPERHRRDRSIEFGAPCDDWDSIKESGSRLRTQMAEIKKSRPGQSNTKRRTQKAINPHTHRNPIDCLPRARQLGRMGGAAIPTPARPVGSLYVRSLPLTARLGGWRTPRVTAGATRSTQVAILCGNCATDQAA